MQRVQYVKLSSARHKLCNRCTIHEKWKILKSANEPKMDMTAGFLLVRSIQINSSCKMFNESRFSSYILLILNSAENVIQLLVVIKFQEWFLH